MSSVSRHLRFDALLIANVPWPVLLERARRVEELGFTAVWLDDHLVNPQRPSDPFLDVWTSLAGLALSTSRIRIGSLVSNIVLRHPAMLARQALTVDHLSGGRLDVGIGSGYATSDHLAVDVPQWGPAERSRRFAEAVETIERLLRGHPAGAPTRPSPREHYRDDALVLSPSSIQRPRPPLTIAAHGPASLDVVARFGDRWSSYGGWGLDTRAGLALARARNEVLDERCAAAGREPGEVRRSLLAGSAAVTPDPIWSSRDAFDDFVGSYRAAGIDEFVFYYPPSNVDPRSNDAVFLDVMAERCAGSDTAQSASALELTKSERDRTVGVSTYVDGMAPGGAA